MIHKLNYIFALVAALFLSGCDICFAPGAGYNTSSIEIDVPVKVKDANPNKPSSLWIDSGETIDMNEKLPMVISGSVNFCEDEIDGEIDCNKSPNCKKVLVPGVFCSDGKPPDYNRDPSTGEVKGSIEHKDLCPNGIMKYGRYVDTGLKVDPGDTVKFKLIPAISIKIESCNPLPKGVSTFGGCNSDGTCINPDDCAISFANKKCIDPVKLCQYGATIDILNKELKVDPFLGKTYTSIIDNYLSPYSNMITSFLRHHSDTNDVMAIPPKVTASLIDLRAPLSLGKRDEYNYKCDIQKTSDGTGTVALMAEELKKFNIYDVLYRCNLIYKGSTWIERFEVTKGEKIAVGLQPTIHYDWEPIPGKTGVERYRRLKVPQPPNYEPNKSWAAHTIAKIGDEKTEYDALGEQCLPFDCLQKKCVYYDDQKPHGLRRGLELNKEYAINAAVPPKSSLMISNGLRGGNTVFAGGYNFEVRKSCIKENGNGLYMYIGNSPPTMKPGDADTYHLVRTLVASADGITTTPQYIINEDNTPPATGKIYFGIKDAENSDTSKKAKTSPENKYTVTIIKPKFSPKFSEPFNLLIDMITKILYGDGLNDKGGVVRIMYEGITGPSNFNAIQAVLALYISLYGVMFAMGLVDHIQVDFATRIVKICVIMLLFSKQSWNFFGYTLHSFFIDGSKTLIGAFSGVLGGDNNKFAFFDLTFGTLLTSETWLRFLSLIFSGPAGFLVFLLVIWGVCLFAMAFMEAIISYVMAIIALSILLVLAPIFITFILFQRTRGLFDGWIKMLINFSLKPVFLFSGLAFLNQILLSTFYAINNFGVCTRKCWLFIEIIKEEGLCFLDVIVPMGFSQTDSIEDRIKQSTQDIEGMGFMGLPFTISSVIIFLVVANLMKVFSGISESIVQAITGSMSSMMEVNRSASQALLSLFGKDDATKGAIDNADRSQNKGKQRANFKAVHDEEDKGVTSNSADINKGGIRGRVGDQTSTKNVQASDASTSESSIPKQVLDSEASGEKSANTTSNIGNASNFIPTIMPNKNVAKSNITGSDAANKGSNINRGETASATTSRDTSLGNYTQDSSSEKSKDTSKTQEEAKLTKEARDTSHGMKPSESTVQRNEIKSLSEQSPSSTSTGDEQSTRKQKDDKS